MEIFYPIIGFENEYEITKTGIVRSVDRLVNSKGKGKQLRIGKIINPSLTNKGYLRVQLSNRKRFSLHRLLAINFIKKEKNDHDIINHINGIRTDNRLENLEWCDFQRNNKHTYTLGFINKNRKLPDEDVIYIYNNGKKGHNGNVTELSKKYNCERTLIINIISNKTYKNITNKLKIDKNERLV